MDKYTLHIKIDDKSIVSLSIEVGEENEVRFKEPIEKYLNLFNSKKYTLDENLTSMECIAYLCFYGPVELMTQTSEVYGFAQYLHESKDKLETKKPIIHLAVSDILSNYRKRYSKIIDSSIWNYFVLISRRDTEELDYSYETLWFSVKNIINNYRYNLYKLSIALEYADFHARLLKSSYLSESNGHGVYISPFLFHSESEHKESSIKKYVKNGEGDNYIYRNGSFAHKWRILLLDDHALSPMSSRIEFANAKEITSREEYINKVSDKLRIISDDLRVLYPGIKIGYVDYNGECGFDSVNEESKSQTPQDSNLTAQNSTNPAGFCTKLCDIIKKIYLQRNNRQKKQSDPTNPSCLKQVEVVSENYSPSENYDIVFYCVSTIDDALHALKHHQFEIVLLDYLLGEKNDKSREYSYELLKKLKDTYKKDEPNTIFGPHDRLYFSFISAFTTAVNERLLAEGLHKSEKFWHIADGACPTNTPYLFLYNLLHLMNKRVEDMGVPRLSNISRDKFDPASKEKAPYVKEDIIDAIYDDSEKKTVRQKANDKFDDVLSLLYHYKKLLEDTDNSPNIFDSKRSVLATEFIKANPSLGGFLEHLTQLVYLTAFGTVRQWPEMWEEYQFISSIVGPQKNIEKYIMKLKSNNI